MSHPSRRPHVSRSMPFEGLLPGLSYESAVANERKEEVTLICVGALMLAPVVPPNVVERDGVQELALHQVLYMICVIGAALVVPPNILQLEGRRRWSLIDRRRPVRRSADKGKAAVLVVIEEHLQLQACDEDVGVNIVAVWVRVLELDLNGSGVGRGVGTLSGKIMTNELELGQETLLVNDDIAVQVHLVRIVSPLIGPVRNIPQEAIPLPDLQPGDGLPERGVLLVQGEELPSSRRAEMSPRRVFVPDRT
mmetsp:Transcript_18719/g.38310  ORF Transcript_18719/g.38310 Transcript_18719/m.38310 type:complete len:251 (+) Transcript_18719:14393-15145(+)